jgi:hypothetical protein
MTSIIVLAVLGGVVAIASFLQGQDWPRPPAWMRVTAAAMAVPLAVFAVLFFRECANNRDAPALGILVVAGGCALLALKLLAWACFGRVRPSSLLGLALRAFEPAPPNRAR